MPCRPARRRSLSAALALCATVVVALAAAAPALATPESYGELLHFGGPGKTAGKFDLAENTNAFGVDQTDGGVYVGDEPGGGEKLPGKFRLQKLNTKDEALGTVEFEASCQAGKGHKCVSEGEQPIEGVAFDTVNSERRAYVLEGWERSEKDKIDKEQIAVGTLYAFSTTPNGEKKLVGAAGTSEGVLASPATFKAESEEQGVALMAPRGIAVDPTTHEIVIAGVIDKGGGSGEQFGEHLALQRVGSDGKLGARYVDPQRSVHNFFAEVNSPVITPDGVILMQTEGQILQIPSDFSSATAPQVVYELDEEESLIEFGEDEEEHGATLSIAPEGANQGTLYAWASVAPTIVTGNGSVLALHYQTEGQLVKVSEMGWLAAASASGSHQCAIGFEGEFSDPMIAAGTEQKVFVLEPGFNLEVAQQQVKEFGPSEKPEGCPKAQASEPQVTFEGVKTTKLKAGKEVTVSSSVTGANSLSVEWNFGDGTPPQTVNVDQHQEPTVNHVFMNPGPITITEMIHDDDLATPTLKKTTNIEVEGSAPKAAFSAGEVSIGQETSFNGEASTDPNGASGLPLEYTWKFGDGTESGPSTAPTIKHKYATAGSFKATLKVTDALHLSNEVTHEVKVKGHEAPKAAFSANEATEGEETSFNGEASADPNGASGLPLEYTWKFGDGTESGPSTAPTIKHKYAKAGGYLVTLKVSDALGLSGEVIHEAKVKVKSTGGGGGGGGTGGGSGGGGGTGGGSGEGPGGPPGGGVQNFTTPTAKVAGASFSVSKAGAVTIKVSCPAGSSGCLGTVTLQTLTAVSARAAAARKRILTLAAGSFSVTGGQTKTVTLHLSATARKLLKKAHSLKAKATVAAHDAGGQKSTVVSTITLRAARH